MSESVSSLGEFARSFFMYGKGYFTCRQYDHINWIVDCNADLSKQRYSAKSIRLSLHLTVFLCFVPYPSGPASRSVTHGARHPSIDSSQDHSAGIPVSSITDESLVASKLHQPTQSLQTSRSRPTITPDYGDGFKICLASIFGLFVFYFTSAHSA